MFSKNASKGSYTTAVSNFYIGGTSSYYLNGYMNDVRYYNHALNSTEVKEMTIADIEKALGHPVKIVKEAE